jgi:capsular exopolysaccharide synthesis family protein
MNKSKHPVAETDQNAFQQVLFKFLPYWPVFVILLALSITGMYFYLMTKTPLYETSASVLIKDEKKGQEDSKMEDVLNVFGTKKIVENELEIFRSNAVISEVVRNMKLYVQYFEDLGWKGLRSAYTSSPIVVDVSNPDSTGATRKVYFDVSADGNTVIIEGKKYPLDEWIDSPLGVVKFARNPNYVTRNTPEGEKIKYYFLLMSIDNATKVVLGSLQVSQNSKLSSIIDLKIKDPIPRRAEAMLTEIVKSYNASAVKRKNSVAMQTLHHIEERLKHVGSELDSVESSIQNYRDRTGTVDIGEQGRMYLQSIGDNDKQISNMDLQIAALNEVEKYVTSKNNHGNIVPSTFNITDPTLNQLLNKLSTTEAQYEKLKRTTGEGNPILQSLQEEINKTIPNILENIRNQRANIESGKNLLNSTNGRYSSLLNSIPKKERQLVEVSRQQNIKNTIYSFLLQKREETAYSISLVFPDCYIVKYPSTSSAPVSPNKSFLFLLAAVAPLGLGVTIISLKDIFNTRILFRSDIEKLVSFPVIGEIIHDNQKNKIVMQNSGRSFIAEQFRQIRTAMNYVGTPRGNCKRTLVTSSIKGEGKSFVSSNLAVSLARSGKKVALLEFDLHQPQLREMFEVERSEGITDYLCDKVKVDEIIKPTEAHPNLFLVPAGYLADEPSDLLLNGKLELLLNYLDAHFDMLVIDTAPVELISDAFNIAPYCNLVLYIVRHKHTFKNHIEGLHGHMESFNVDNVAIIFNDVSRRGYGKYGYGPGYGYGYDSKTLYDSYNK